MPDQSHAEYRLSRFYFEETAATELKSVNIRPRTRCKCPPSPPQSALASFALDRSNCLSARELRKNNVRIKLQEQPFRVLVELAANAGKVVSREELQQKLWPADTFVDFDVGLNTAIRKLRQALNVDSRPEWRPSIQTGRYSRLPELPGQEHPRSRSQRLQSREYCGLDRQQ